MWLCHGLSPAMTVDIGKGEEQVCEAQTRLAKPGLTAE